MLFKDRFDAGYQLSQKLEQYKNNSNLVVLAIPRGGLEVGSVLAQELHAPLDIILTKKIGAPNNPEAAIGAVSLEHVILDKSYDLSMLKEYILEQVKNIQELLKQRYKQYTQNTKPINIKNKIVILTDDGIATGNTVRAAIGLIKKHSPKKIILAIPVAPPDVLSDLSQEVDEILCLATPEPFFGVGQFYEKFDQVSDQEAIKLLHARL